MSADFPIVVLADDLSGAAEIAGIAFAHGYSTEVQRQFEPSTAAQVIAIDSGTRHLPATEAAARLREITTRVLAIPHAWLFKKVDSVLRGNIHIEIAAMLEITGQQRAILIPANPTRGRTIVNGQYLLDGVPLNQTQFANDPDHPRQSADVCQLLGSGGKIPIHTMRGNEMPGESGIYVPDMISTRQLEQLSASVTNDTLLAGAADFFTHFLIHHGNRPANIAPSPAIALDPPILLICGSAASWPARHADCLAANVPTISIQECTSPPNASFYSLLLGIGQPRLAHTNPTLLSMLSHLAIDIAEIAQVKTILMEGGATAAALTEHMRWSRFAVATNAPTGVAALRPLELDAPLVLVKPGSYPWPQGIWQLFCNRDAQTIS